MFSGSDLCPLDLTYVLWIRPMSSGSDLAIIYIVFYFTLNINKYTSQQCTEAYYGLLCVLEYKLPCSVGLMWKRMCSCTAYYYYVWCWIKFLLCGGNKIPLVTCSEFNKWSILCWDNFHHTPVYLLSQIYP